MAAPLAAEGDATIDRLRLGVAGLAWGYGQGIGAIEGANGIILLGWSTAFFFAVVDRMKLLERELENA